MQINEFDHPDHGWKWRECEVRWIEAKIAEAVSAEREACAKVCETHWEGGSYKLRDELAAAIRERSNAGIEAP